MMTWELYDKDLFFVSPIDHVLGDGYEIKHNELSTASLELSVHDDVVDRIDVPASYARIRDGDEDLGFFRFVQIPREEHAPRGQVSYVLHSGECSLLDSMLSGWHEIGGTDMSTRMVLEYILRHQSMSSAAHWVLGDCEFEDYYQYNFEDVTLLEAIMSLGEVLLEPYEFVFDTTVRPWTMHLRKVEESAYCSLVYRRNMTAIRRSITGGVVTRLHGRGYGEGDNQLTIASVNDGRDYLDADAAAIARWGIREGVHVDTRQTDPALLKARMQAILAAGSQPQVSYEADAIDLYKATGASWDRVQVGRKVLVLDEIMALPVTVRVTSKKKTNASGREGEISYVLDNSIADTAQELNEILEKIGVHELYSQGATNMYSMQTSENADAEHPLEMRFYVPGNVLRINSCIVYWQLERFRTHVKTIAAEKESSRTSKGGGGATVSLPQTVTSFSAPTSNPIGPGDEEITDTGGGGSHSHTLNITASLPPHSHTLSSNSVSNGYTGGLNTTPDVTVNGSTRSGGSHTHDMTHVHVVTAQMIIPAMRFELESHSHTFVIPEHTHDLEYGIYEGDRAESLSLRVDGVDVPPEAITDREELDIAQYLRKNDDGKVVRGTWHRIEFVPSGNTRITADLFFQVFIQSRGAGDY
jgi:phage minor structural protein